MKLGKILILLFVFSHIFAQDYDILFEHFDTKNGLTQNSVTAIAQDELGYIWFSTQNGLNKFDGYNFTAYLFDPDNKKSMQGNWINHLIADKHGKIWIFFGFGGIDCFDINTEEFEHFTHDEKKTSSLPEKYLRYAYLDKWDNLWLGTFENGILKFDRDKNTFIKYSNHLSNKSSLSSNRTLCAFADTLNGNKNLWIGTANAGINQLNIETGEIERIFANREPVTTIERIDDELWIGTWGGSLNKINLKTNKTKSYKIEIKRKDTSGNYLQEIKKDSRNRIWAIDKDFRLLCFDTEKEVFIKLKNSGYDFENILVTKILEDNEGTIWVGTRKDGLYKLIIGSGKIISITNYKYNTLNPKSISYNSINYLFQDVSGNTWIATNGGGVNKINIKKQKFRLINGENNNGLKLSSPRVTSFAEDNSGNIWIGTAVGGINKFDLKKNAIEKIKLPDEIFKNIGAIYFDGKENLYICPYWQGVYKFNINKKNYDKINGGKYSGIINKTSVSCITKDTEGNIWMGLFDGGVYKINEKSGAAENFTQIANDPSSLPSTAVWNIYIDKNSDVWIATASGGISKLIKGTSKFKNYSNTGKDPYRFPNNTATYFYEDSKGNFWVGSFSAGISLMDRKTEKFEYYTIKNGLPGNRIDGILEDKKGNLWISTNNGISKFDPVKKTFRNYDYMDGLQDNEFIRSANLKTKAGIMFFGGDHGLNYFYPDEIKDNFYIPKINITAFKKSNEEIKFDKSLEAIEQIELSYNEVQISFEFVALDYTSPEKNKYAYKMEGFDNDWVYSGKRRYANYTNLFPGEYVFKVIGSNSDGVWNTEGASIKIIVHPPFWNTWWFYLLAAAVLFSSAVSIHRYIVQKKIRQMLEHEKIRNSEREKVREELSRDFHDELGHKLTRISMYARNIIKKKNSSSTELIDELEKVNETSQSLHLGAKDLIWSLNPGEDTLYDAVIRLKDFGDDLFDKTGINFGAKGISEDFKSIKLPMEWKRHLTLIFKESMNNILKYAECENVLFRIEIENKILILELSDDGKGFELNGDSNGYGLNNIKKRAENIKGTINIVSGENKGTLIIFSADISHLYD